jgi:hypothetical protein
MTRAEQQLTELYLPLLVLQRRGQKVFHMLLATLGRTYVFAGYTEQLPDREMALWNFWLENAFIPMNDQMLDVIKRAEEENLFDGDMPYSFKHLFQYQELLKQAHDRWVAGEKYQHPGNFPDDLESDILDAIGGLSLETSWVPKFLT